MTTSNVGFIFCIVNCIVQYGLCWKNGYDLPLNFVCPANKMISYIRSVHNNVAEDRVWDFRCRRNPYGSNGCSWSGWVNSWDETFAFICPDNRYISGIRSYHNNQAEDRRHNFYCCKSREKVIVHSCHFTLPNGFDTQIQQTVPYGYTWKGVISNHNNAAEDRQFVFLLCRLST
ncbi:dermatopontin-like [Mytilus edulis]|uniref:dermatopontin-like n=1 Tax=Mytilus edulis TaxID=6550 RepID=UPI0039EFD08A